MFHYRHKIFKSITIILNYPDLELIIVILHNILKHDFINKGLNYYYL